MPGEHPPGIDVGVVRPAVRVPVRRVAGAVREGLGEVLDLQFVRPRIKGEAQRRMDLLHEDAETAVARMDEAGQQARRLLRRHRQAGDPRESFEGLPQHAAVGLQRDGGDVEEGGAAGQLLVRGDEGRDPGQARQDDRHRVHGICPTQ